MKQADFSGIYKFISFESRERVQSIISMIIILLHNQGDIFITLTRGSAYFLAFVLVNYIKHSFLLIEGNLEP